MTTGGALEALAKSIAEVRHALWLGAGVSFASGVPTVAPLRRRILHGVGLSDREVESYESAQVPFESLIEVLTSASECGELFKVFRGAAPSLCHLVAAELVKRNLVKTILTTNFDQLVEDALDIRGVEYDLYASDETFPKIDWTSDRPRVIKIHGTIQYEKQLAVTIRRVAARRFTDIRGNVVQKLAETESGGGIVILGYSCSDHFDLTPAARRAATPSRRVHYVHHSTEHCSPSAVALASKYPANPFAGYDAQCVTCSTDDLLLAIWRQLSCGPPPADPPTIPANSWEFHVDRWLESVSEPGMTEYLAGLLMKSANMWMASITRLAKAIDSGVAQTIVPKALLAMGNNFRDLGRLDDAKAVLAKAEQKARLENSESVLARILNSLGIVSADEGDFEGAIKRYNEALPLAAGSDDELEGKCHGNLGIAKKNRKTGNDLQDALEHQARALKIAVEIGDKRSEGRTLGNTGLVYRELGNISESCAYYDKARMVAESLGDLLHVGIWLHNAGEDLATTEPASAKRMLSQSRDIFTRLNQEDFAQQSNAILDRLNRKC